MSDTVQPLLDALHARGDAPFLLMDDRTITGGEFRSALQLMAGLMHSRPVPPDVGSVVGLRGGDVVTLLFAAFGAWRLGLSTAFLSPREPDDRVPALLGDAGCRLHFDGTGLVDLAPASTPRDGSLDAVSSTLIWTSGTSGTSKIVVHGLDAHIASARDAASYFDLGFKDTWLLSLPVHHVGGLSIVIRTALSGARLAVPEADTTLADALVRVAPTHVSLVPTQLRRLLANEEAAEALGACRAVLVGGGPIPLDLRVRALDRGIPLVVSYGMTETAAFVAATADPELVRRPRCVGHPLRDRPVRIAADGGILVGGPTLFEGYLEDGRVRAALDEDGLFATGDRGRLDDDGALIVEGRLDRMFISGGENVQPEEIEAALEALAGVETAVVVDVADVEYGRRPVAFVRGREGALDGEQLAADVRQRLAGFKVPDAFYRLPDAEPNALKPSPARIAALLRADTAEPI